MITNKSEYPKYVSVLGTKYTIEMRSYEEDPSLKGIGGYCEDFVPPIVLCDLQTSPTFKDESKEQIYEATKRVLRHEVIHAFFNESGLSGSALHTDMPWVENEEMVDWFAKQFPNMLTVFKELECL